ncbi:hypothetical protein AKJ09_03956 [Labilithrix luteola]|uniref:Uncharacterized protein n=1 Tax=Labilithrix luteola TaxID=1391654 RepID=A0A0K1PUU7_9BACT|nr:hypothetical protein AKJ09_03956 [Labilithrix luteola]
MICFASESTVNVRFNTFHTPVLVLTLVSNVVPWILTSSPLATVCW